MSSLPSTVESIARQYRSLIRSCARRVSLHDAEKLHASAITAGLSTIPKTYILNALLHVYSKCGDYVYAHKVFDQIPLPHKDAFDWTALIACYNQLKIPIKALSLFREMRGCGVEPDTATMSCVFQACGQVGDVFGYRYLGLMVKMGLDFTTQVCNSILDLYVKCGLMDAAKRLFDEMEERSVVTWTIILDGLVRWEGVDSGKALFDAMPEKNEVAWTIMAKGFIANGCVKEALLLLREMVFGLEFRLNHVTLCSLLSGCVQSGDLMTGKWVHTYYLKTTEDEQMHAMVATALIDMYAKCGRINLGLRVFDSMRCRNVATWNAMLSGLSMHGQGDAVLLQFSHMLKEAKPDAITMTSVLNACSHSGLIEQGLNYFHSMKAIYGVTPQVEHYACVVDLLGRAGRVKEADNLIRTMPMRPNSVVLGSLRASCRVHKELDVADNLSKDFAEIDVNDTECHVLLSNLYTSTGRLDKANFLRQDLKEKGIKKIPGVSSIHVAGQIHRFISNDRSHSRINEIYSKLDEVIQKLRLSGYVPRADAQVFSGCDGEENNLEELEEKEQALFSHSEKLAVCFGLMSTKPGMPLYIFKNLTICQDCHSAMKLLSSIYEREIVIRDRSRFHSFKQGSCSCSDYW